MKSSIALILDDHELFNDSFSSLIERLNMFDKVSSFTNDADLLAFLMKNEYNSTYLFVDYYLKDKISISIISDTKRLCKNIKIIFVSSVVNPLLIKNILNYNPNGFISKSSNFEIVLRCMSDIHNKNQYLCPVIKEILDNNKLEKEVNFTARELEILQYFSRGYSKEKTAELSNLSKHTIVAHRRNMMTKANCKSITELLWYSRNLGLV